MFETITPEAAGIPSGEVLRFLRSLENRGLRMHAALLMKGDSIFGEYYWKPFDRDFCHRMYSQTKSYVSIAIGFLEQEGKIDLDAPIADYFPEKIDRELPPYLSRQTVRDTLTMRTCGDPANWFYAGDPDRTHLYFATQSADHPSGTLFRYDSAGSQVLAALVEKLAGMSLFDYLYDRVFRHLGTFRTAEILKTPNGDSWGDSALVCTLRDMASFARFLMRGGEVDGKQLLGRAYIDAATTKQTATDEESSFAYGHGYGYQIWQHERGGFCFVGMGCQYTIALPALDLLFCCTADNQGYPAADPIFGAFFDFIADTAADTPLPENPAALDTLRDYASRLRLYAAKGEKSSPIADRVGSKTFVLGENPMGIAAFSLTFGGDGTGCFRYTNAQGEKEIPFGLCENVFGTFPQDGYSDGAGCVPTTDGFRYRSATSGAWTAENVFRLDVQIIDRYFGNLTMLFGFAGDEVYLKMIKTAEAFLDEYQGTAVGRMRS